MPPDVFVGDRDALHRRLAEAIEEERTRARTRSGSPPPQRGGLFSIALPGGSVAEHALPILATMSFDWEQTHIFWVDERAVPAESTDSNYRLAEELWLRPRAVPASAIHRMPAERDDLSDAASAYERELTRTLGSAPRLDLVLLGVGEDGHVASLFPGHAALAETGRLVLPVFDSPKPPARRLTLTPPVLTGADLVLVMALGAGKATIVRKALVDRDHELPVTRVLDGSARSLVLLDPAAASAL